MLIREQSDLVKALLTTVGIAGATTFDVRSGWLIVDGVPHRVHAEAVRALDASPVEAPATEPTAPATPPADPAPFLMIELARVADPAPPDDPTPATPPGDPEPPVTDPQPPQ